jgi:hypothetical protein
MIDMMQSKTRTLEGELSWIRPLNNGIIGAEVSNERWSFPESRYRFGDET